MDRRTFPIYLVIFLDMLGFGTIIPVIRDLTRELVQMSDLNEDHAEIYGGLLMASYSFAQFLASPIWGRLSDIYGRKRILMMTLAGNILAYGMWGISSNFGVFLLSRLLAGFSGGNLSVAQSYLVDVTSAQERAKAMGLMGAIFGLGFILGPFLGAELSQWHLGLGGGNSYASIGYFCMVLSLINFSWVVVSLRDMRKRQPSNRKLFHPSVLWKEVRSSKVSYLLGAYFFLQAGFVQLEAVLAWDLWERFAYDTRTTGHFFAALGIVMVLVQGGIYRVLVNRWDLWKITTRGMVGVIAAYLILPLQTMSLAYFSVICLMAYGLGTVNPSLPTLISLQTRETEQGFQLGLMHSLGAITRIIAPILATGLFHAWSFAPFYLSALFSALALMLFLRQRKNLNYGH
ncbi:MAG: MFS transporter [Leptospiraceae bacterium]|nr:MFS transporter [Leptospiraceae bacterium]MDW8307707.1 MFS transporter [Leptospiraceae bacterium]